MREIKFRAWDDHKKKMYSFDELDFLDQFKEVYFYTLIKGEYADFKPSEYTGLKDSNGIEIYEGDIIYFTYFGLFDTDEQHNGIVKYDDERAEYLLEVIGSKQEERFSLGWIHYQDDEIEIIGNIYKNPELLETK